MEGRETVAVGGPTVVDKFCRGLSGEGRLFSEICNNVRTVLTVMIKNNYAPFQDFNNPDGALRSSSPAAAERCLAERFSLYIPKEI